MYRKILIKSPEDLPKWSKDDKFIVHLNEGRIAYRFGYMDNDYWEDVDWYLIESPISVPTAIEAEKEGNRLGEREDSNGEKFINSDYTEGFEDCYKWMRDEIIKRNK